MYLSTLVEACARANPCNPSSRRRQNPCQFGRALTNRSVPTPIEARKHAPASPPRPALRRRVGRASRRGHAISQAACNRTQHAGGCHHQEATSQPVAVSMRHQARRPPPIHPELIGRSRKVSAAPLSRPRYAGWALRIMPGVSARSEREWRWRRRERARTGCGSGIPDQADRRTDEGGKAHHGNDGAMSAEADCNLIAENTRGHGRRSWRARSRWEQRRSRDPRPQGAELEAMSAGYGYEDVAKSRAVAEHRLESQQTR